MKKEILNVEEDPVATATLLVLSLEAEGAVWNCVEWLHERQEKQERRDKK